MWSQATWMDSLLISVNDLQWGGGCIRWLHKKRLGMMNCQNPRCEIMVEHKYAWACMLMSDCQYIKATSQANETEPGKCDNAGDEILSQKAGWWTEIWTKGLDQMTQYLKSRPKCSQWFKVLEQSTLHSPSAAFHVALTRRYLSFLGISQGQYRPNGN